MTAQYALGAVLVVGVLIAVAAVAAGFADRLSPTWRDSRPLQLPAGRRLAADDLEQTRFAIAFRGYRMHEVDTVLDRLATEVAERDAQLDELTTEVESLRAIVADQLNTESLEAERTPGTRMPGNDG